MPRAHGSGRPAVKKPEKRGVVWSQRREDVDEKGAVVFAEAGYLCLQRLYAPSLRQLRAVPLVFQLRKPTVPRRLAQRLRSVADSEGVASAGRPSNFS